VQLPEVNPFVARKKDKGYVYCLLNLNIKMFLKNRE
jgi:hypothetical protein